MKYDTFKLVSANECQALLFSFGMATYSKLCMAISTLKKKKLAAI